MLPNPQFPADLVAFTEESLMENFNFCAVYLGSCQASMTKPIYEKMMGF